MKVIVITLLTMLTTQIPSQFAEPKGWRGIIPLRTTKADVERVLGKSTSSCDCSYRLPDMTVHIAYSRGYCENGWNVARSTVIHISVSLKKNRPKLSELDIDINEYQRTPDPKLSDVFYYKNKQDGRMLVVNNGMVTEINYSPSSEDNHLMCPQK